MTNFSRGEVVMVEIAFSGTPGRKKRPAVVVSVESYQLCLKQGQVTWHFDLSIFRI